MNKYDGLSRAELEHMVEALSNVLMYCVDAQTAEYLLRTEGFESEHLEAIGFEMEG